ncbi:MAG TPA: Holliday junction resolvase RuvX [Bryobacteraceae bacterium]|nr:Holliday junction resolvase RuvX [Bryobacteraceae bacterium]
MRILAVDYGRKRIGLAISDPLGVMAHGMETLQRRSLRKDLTQLCALIREQQVRLLVVGNPLHLDGSPSEMSQEAESFASRLSEQCGVPYRMWDERLTSQEAGHLLRETGRSVQRDGGVDRLAAQIILDSFLAAQ